jgi:uncharacterized coiled-coil protein SlyX
MQSLEERLAYLEGQVNEHSHSMIEVRNAVRDLERRVDMRFEAVDRRFESMERRLDGMNDRIDSLDDKVSRQFVWLVGMQVTTLVAIVGALLTKG